MILRGPLATPISMRPIFPCTPPSASGWPAAKPVAVLVGTFVNVVPSSDV